MTTLWFQEDWYRILLKSIEDDPAKTFPATLPKLVKGFTRILVDEVERDALQRIKDRIFYEHKTSEPNTNVAACCATFLVKVFEAEEELKKNLLKLEGGE